MRGGQWGSRKDACYKHRLKMRTKRLLPKHRLQKLPFQSTLLSQSSVPCCQLQRLSHTNICRSSFCKAKRSDLRFMEQSPSVTNVSRLLSRMQPKKETLQLTCFIKSQRAQVSSHDCDGHLCTDVCGNLCTYKSPISWIDVDRMIFSSPLPLSAALTQTFRHHHWNWFV